MCGCTAHGFFLLGGGFWCACDTYSLETNGSGDGVENGVSVGEVGEASCLDAFEVHGLEREGRTVTIASDFSPHKICFTSISFVKRYMDMVVLL